ncbi:hypothetical protein [Plantactinospora sp. KLBMP9567]|uniref:hypothetical protein n=1 Tax=Plantactinospora sp. KLBMP9567 TaxID=3085900 RepID=UPI00298115EA|nr:hypothetical protein [Plantactinospora sp. KLBMP9567]MDW5323571.1 hypothetical protein [Plantactinospora sp. KLBMP9567]
MYAAAFLAAGEPTGNRWIMAVAGVAVTVSCVRLVLHEARLDDRARRDQRRLEAIGVPATAEITAVRPTSPGEESGIELRLLISASGPNRSNPSRRAGTTRT